MTEHEKAGRVGFEHLAGLEYAKRIMEAQRQEYGGVHMTALEALDQYIDQAKAAPVIKQCTYPSCACVGGTTSTCLLGWDRASPTAPTAGVDECAIAGALFDFGGFLTTRSRRITCSELDDASPMVKALEEFAAKRCLSLDQANVTGWQDLIAAAPTVQGEAGEQIMTQARTIQAKDADIEKWKALAHQLEQIAETAVSINDRDKRISALTAQPAAVPEGCKLVPIEPTDEQLLAAASAAADSGIQTTHWLRTTIYNAMLAAAPQQPLVVPEVGGLAHQVLKAQMEIATWPDSVRKSYGVQNFTSPSEWIVAHASDSGEGEA